MVIVKINTLEKSSMYFFCSRADTWHLMFGSIQHKLNKPQSIQPEFMSDQTNPQLGGLVARS